VKPDGLIKEFPYLTWGERLVQSRHCGGSKHITRPNWPEEVFSWLGHGRPFWQWLQADKLCMSDNLYISVCSSEMDVRQLDVRQRHEGFLYTTSTPRLPIVALYSLPYRAPYCPWFPIVKHCSLELDVQQRHARLPTAMAAWLPIVALLSALKGYLLAPYILALYSTFLASGFSGQNMHWWSKASVG